MQAFSKTREIHPCESNADQHGPSPQKRRRPTALARQRKMDCESAPCGEAPVFLRIELPPVAPDELPPESPRHEPDGHEKKTRRHGAAPDAKRREKKNGVACRVRGGMRSHENALQGRRRLPRENGPSHDEQGERDGDNRGTCRESAPNTRRRPASSRPGDETQKKRAGERKRAGCGRKRQKRIAHAAKNGAKHRMRRHGIVETASHLVDPPAILTERMVYAYLRRRNSTRLAI